MFEGFRLEHVDVGDAVLRVRHGGEGPPLLLLHGHPRTHVTWHRVAPRLAPHFTLVCPDLRGYGASSKPVTTPDHAPYSKRAMAGDMAALMGALGHERFTVAGHDRGAYVAFRLALDHPAAVERLVVMDAVPIAEALERCDARFARACGTGSSSARPRSRPSVSSPPTRTPGTPPRRSRWARTLSRTGGGPSTTPRPCTRWARTTGPASGSTASMTRPIAPPDAAWRARRCSCGRSATTWRSSTATRWRSGGSGRRRARHGHRQRPPRRRGRAGGAGRRARGVRRGYSSGSGRCSPGHTPVR
jgi:pimeloyl-ACP methyl ester carboxylesterase